MARYTMSVRTEMAPEDAFAYLSDLSNFDEWDPGIRRAEQVEGAGPGEGAVYELDASGTTFRYVVEQFDPPRFGHRSGPLDDPVVGRHRHRRARRGGPRLDRDLRRRPDAQRAPAHRRPAPEARVRPGGRSIGRGLTEKLRGRRIR
ncbi:MAG: SRPBCC family protein [Acidimicrobiales bacterium]